MAIPRWKWEEKALGQGGITPIESAIPDITGHPALYLPTIAPEIKRGGGGGGLTVKPWWDILPTTPTTAVIRTIETPTVSPVGLIKSPAQVGAKTVVKLGLLGAIGGFIGGLLFGGGGQEQQQDITQIPTVTPTVTPIVTPIVTPTVTPTISPIVAPDISILDSIIHGGVGTTTIYDYIFTHQPTTTITETTTITPTYTWTGATQEATAEQGMNLMQLAIVGGLLLGGAYLLRGKI